MLGVHPKDCGCNACGETRAVLMARERGRSGSRAREERKACASVTHRALASLGTADVREKAQISVLWREALGGLLVCGRKSAGLGRPRKPPGAQGQSRSREARRAMRDALRRGEAPRRSAAPAVRPRGSPRPSSALAGVVMRRRTSCLQRKGEPCGSPCGRSSGRETPQPAKSVTGPRGRTVTLSAGARPGLCLGALRPGSIAIRLTNELLGYAPPTILLDGSRVRPRGKRCPGKRARWRESARLRGAGCAADRARTRHGRLTSGPLSAAHSYRPGPCGPRCEHQVGPCL